MKTLIASTATALVLATVASAGQNNTVDAIERELIRSGQTDLAERYDQLSEAEKRKLLFNESPWVRQATHEWIWNLYN